MTSSPLLLPDPPAWSLTRTFCTVTEAGGATEEAWEAESELSATTLRAACERARRLLSCAAQHRGATLWRDGRAHTDGKGT